MVTVQTPEEAQARLDLQPSHRHLVRVVVAVRVVRAAGAEIITRLHFQGRVAAAAGIRAMASVHSGVFHSRMAAPVALVPAATADLAAEAGLPAETRALAVEAGTTAEVPAGMPVVHWAAAAVDHT